MKAAMTGNDIANEEKVCAVESEDLCTYEIYLRNHVQNVARAFKWMFEHHVIGMPDVVSYEDGQIYTHDMSKYCPEEFSAYNDYFYGKEGKDADDIAVIDNAFDYAWLHHIHNNPHHWQYWVLTEDEGKAKALEMPKKYVYEMIADWWSFSWTKGDLKEIFQWYEDHRNKMTLHENTKKLVEEILNKIKDILDQEESETSKRGKEQ